MKNHIRETNKKLSFIHHRKAFSILSMGLGMVVLTTAPSAFSHSKRKPKSIGAGWVTTSYNKADSKYTVSGSGVNTTVKTPTVNAGAVFKVTDKASLGGFIMATPIGRSESITTNSGATINGTGAGVLASYVIHPNLLGYGSYVFSENRSKISRVSAPNPGGNSATGLSSSRGTTRAFSLGASLFAPVNRTNMSNFKVQYSNTQSRTSAYVLGGADPLALLATNTYPASKAYIQSLMVSGRITNSSHESFRPFVEWRGIYVMAYSNNLKNMPFRMGNEISLGADFPLDDILSLEARVDYGAPVLPGRKLGGSLSLKYKF